MEFQNPFTLGDIASIAFSVLATMASAIPWWGWAAIVVVGFFWLKDTFAPRGVSQEAIRKARGW